MSDGCRLDHLRLFNFRNYAEATVEFGPGLNVIAGANAQGKTNLLEAVACLALTRSPRAGSAADVVRWGSDEALVRGVVVRPTGPTELVLRLARATSDTPPCADGGDDGRSAPVTRTTTVDGKPRRARDVLGLCPIVLFSPDDLQLVKGGPDGRRRRLDMLLSQLDPRAAADLLRYRRALEQRNALLRHLRAGGGSMAALEGFTRDVVDTGSRVRLARRRLVAAMSPLIETALAALSGGEGLTVTYVAGSDRRGQPGDAAEEAAQLAAQLADRRGEELARGMTAAGPHRDDVDILLGGHPARSTASQGQQRTIVLALALAEVAHIRTVAEVSPLLILDDVLSELDRRRRHLLLAEVSGGAGLQVLVTTAEPEIVERLDVPAGRHFVVSDGTVARAHDAVGAAS